MQPEFSLEEYLRRVSAQIEARLELAISETARPAPDMLGDAIRYAVLGGGKRIRPALVLASAQAFGGDTGDGSLAVRFAVAMEMIHTYSLVHDDLPCMDDDDLRRGRPTVHKAFDEATAVLVGDALQSLAFEHLLGSPDPRVGELGQLLASSAFRMVQGQALDMAAQAGGFGEQEVLDLMGGKTAALIAAAVAGGALAGSGSDQGLFAVGWKLGLAFQMADDLLDRTSNVATLGKRAGKDAVAGKATLPALVGEEEARRRAEAYADEVLKALPAQASRTEALRALAKYAVTRRK